MNPISVGNMAAAPGTAEAYAFVEKFNDIILFPLIILMTGIAFLVFLYGCFVYIINAENSSAREEGRNHIIYSLIGMFVMLVAYTILQIAAATFGVDPELDCANDPSKAGCTQIMTPFDGVGGGNTNGSGGNNTNGSGGNNNQGTGGNN